jgi:hypothetical protein
VVWNGDILSSATSSRPSPIIAPTAAKPRWSSANKARTATSASPTKCDVTRPCATALGKTDPAYQYTGICVVTKAFAQGVPATIESLVEHFLRRTAGAAGQHPGFPGFVEDLA